MTAGNKTEDAMRLLWGVGLGVGTIAGALYFMLWQFYVVLVELILNGVLLGLAVLETGFGLIVFFSFKNFEKSN